MPGLLEIAATPKTVTVNGQELPVYGISIEGIAVLIGKFPELREVFKSGIELKLKDIEPEQIAAYAPRIARALIAAACGEPGNAKAEEIAGKLPLSTQITILEMAYELTAPEGISPFVARLQKMGVLGATATAPKDSASGGHASTSEKPSKPSSQAA